MVSIDAPLSEWICGWSLFRGRPQCFPIGGTTEELSVSNLRMRLQRMDSWVWGARAEHVSTSRTRNSIYLCGVRGESGASARVLVGRFSGF